MQLVGSWFLDQGLNPGLRELKRRVLTAGLSENAPLFTFLTEEILETFPLWSGTKH